MKYKIKRLAWQRACETFVLHTVFGAYAVFEPYPGESNWKVLDPEYLYSHGYKTADEAKAAARADYQKRLMPALHEVDQ